MRSPLRRAFAVSIALHLVVLPLLIALLAAPSADLATNFAPERVTVEGQRMTIVARSKEPRRSVRSSGRRALADSALADSIVAPREARAPVERTHVAVALVAARLTRRAPTTGSEVVTVPKLASDARPDTLTTARDRTREHDAPSSANIGPKTHHDNEPGDVDARSAGATGASGAAGAPEAASAGVALVVATATPAPVPTATPDAQLARDAVARDASARSAQVVAVGGWGQNFDKPIVADETALADLRRRYRLAASVSVAVDPSGRAMHVSMPASVPADVRERLEHDLLALRYVPAECNGLRCEGTAALDL
jgi:hypothetical protein